MSSAYREAATVMDAVLSRKVGLRSAALGSNVKDKRKVMALVTRTMEYKNDIERAIEAIPGAREKLHTIIPGRSMRLLMIYDLILGNGKISGGGKAARACKELKEELTDLLASVKKAKDESDATTSKEPVKRWIRVNTIKTNMNTAEGELREFMQASSTPSSAGNSSVDLKRKHEGENATNYEDNVISRDVHVENLLLCLAPPGLAFYSHPRVKDGSWILQDKASCFSAEALAGRNSHFTGGDVIDACAAPGNKTTHAASLLKMWNDKGKSNDKAKVFAFDRDATRLKTLQTRAANAGCGGSTMSSLETLSEEAPSKKKPKKKAQAGTFQLVVAECADFLQVDENLAKYSNVRSMLVDPSCSGSGIVGIDRAIDKTRKSDKKEIEKIESLARFQQSVILKAMSFPNVTRVVYSTCSIHDEENELVVAAVLDQFNQADRSDSLSYSLRPCLPSWPRRGKVVGGLSEEQAACLVRADPLLDDTHGFFVAHFERSDSTSSIPLSLSKTSGAIVNIPTNAPTVITNSMQESNSSKKNKKKREKRRLKRIKLRQENASTLNTADQDEESGSEEEQ